MSDFWESLASFQASNEADVETRLVLPLLEALGWPRAEIHSKVPVEFQQGRKRGRKPEADFVTAPATPSPPQLGQVVVEAKHPNESLDDAESQAFSYCYALRAPFYLTTNGAQLEIWRVGVFEADERVISCPVADLPRVRGDLETTVGRAAVLTFLEKVKAKRVAAAEPDLGRYLAHIAGRTGMPARLADRVLWAGGDRGRPFSELASDALAPGAWTHVVGLGGRGKTTTLLSLTAVALRSGRAVAFLSGRWRGRSLGDRLSETLKAFVTELATPEACLAWLRKTKPLLVFDEWDLVDAAERASLENALASYLTDGLSVISSGRPGLDEPRKRTSRWELRPLSFGEQLAISSAVLRPGRGNRGLADSLLQSAPIPVRRLLGEPIVLATYLEYRTDTSFDTSVHSLFDVFSIVLARTCALDSNRLRLSQDEVAAVLGGLRETKSFGLQQISDHAQRATIAHAAADIAECLLDLGFIIRVRPGIFEVSHDVWRIYFDVAREVAGAARLSGAQARALLRESPDEDVRLTGFLVAGLMQDSEARSSFLETVLRRSPALYFDCVLDLSTEYYGEHSRPAQRATEFVDEVARGYLEVAEVALSGVMGLLGPWGRVHPDDAHAKVAALAGELDGAYLRYRVGFCEPLPDGRRSVSLAAPGASFTFDGSERFCNLASMPAVTGGWLVGTEGLVENVRSLVSNRRLEFVWASRERLLGWVLGSRSDLSWAADLSVDQLLAALPAEISATKEAAKLDVDGGADAGKLIVSFYAGGREIVPEDWLVGTAKDLADAGLGDVRIRDLGLPGPDKTQDGSLSTLAGLYSTGQRVARVKRLLEAVVSSYHTVVDRYFRGLAAEFAFGGAPVRGVAVVDRDEQAFATGWRYWFEPVPDWTSPALVWPRGDEPEDCRTMQTIEKRVQRMARDLDRPMSTFSLVDTVGEWSKISHVVTDYVHKLVKRDLDRVPAHDLFPVEPAPVQSSRP